MGMGSRSHAGQRGNIDVGVNPGDFVPRLEILRPVIDSEASAGYVSADHECHCGQISNPPPTPTDRLARTWCRHRFAHRRNPATVRRGWKHDRDAPARCLGFRPHLHLGRVEPTCQRALLLWIVQFIGFELIGIVVVRLIILGIVLVLGIQLWIKLLGVVVIRFGLLRLVIGIVIKFRGLLCGRDLSIRCADPADRYRGRRRDPPLLLQQPMAGH